MKFFLIALLAAAIRHAHADTDISCENSDIDQLYYPCLKQAFDQSRMKIDALILQAQQAVSAGTPPGAASARYRTHLIAEEHTRWQGYRDARCALELADLDQTMPTYDASMVACQLSANRVREAELIRRGE